MYLVYTGQVTPVMQKQPDSFFSCVRCGLDQEPEGLPNIPICYDCRSAQTRWEIKNEKALTYESEKEPTHVLKYRGPHSQEKRKSKAHAWWHPAVVWKHAWFNNR